MPRLRRPSHNQQTHESKHPLLAPHESETADRPPHPASRTPHPASRIRSPLTANRVPHPDIFPTHRTGQRFAQTHEPMTRRLTPTSEKPHRDFLQIPDLSMKEIDNLFALAEKMRGGK